MAQEHRGWKGIMDAARAAYELPLGLASFAIFKLLRKAIYRIGRMAYRKNPEAFQRWRVLSGQVLSQPHQLSRYMVVAPRWNPHAAVGSAGPVAVREKVEIDLAGIPKDVEYWFFGALRFPSFASAGYVSSLSKRDADGKLVLHVPPGDYYIACRYYGWPPGVGYPSVLVDGKRVVPPCDTEGDINDFYPDLHRRERAIYRVAHYHVYVMLKYRKLFSTAFVKRHLLPVGNEDTHYRYGAVQAGQSLRMMVPDELFREHRVFCTVYNTASLPVVMFELSTTTTDSGPLPCNGSYLLRIMRIRGEAGSHAADDREDEITISVTDAQEPRPAIA